MAGYHQHGHSTLCSNTTVLHVIKLHWSHSAWRRIYWTGLLNLQIPIKHLWEVIEKKLKTSTKNQLWESLQEAWSDIPPGVLLNLVDRINAI